TAVAVSVVGLPMSSTPEAAAVEPAPAAFPAETTTTTVTAAAPLPPVAVTPPPQLARGAEGADVLRLQERLVQLHYDPGTADGRYGEGTALAVMAFQKVSGLNRTGVADPATLEALASAADPAPLVPAGAPTRVEVDMARQVLFAWADGQLVRILPVSTGNGKRYCEHGNCGVAVTPLGEFRAERRIPGLHRAPLGVLFNPVYFHNGFAIHGSPSIPPYPASHGCVRVPIHSSRWIYDHIANGTPIHLI
ncbi:MAG TPA: L,D-transpeptidase family protein, partial [Acidimicrobiia bacterium]|nr:L,D-transpeptidase family protein [Acidimicrobiia bacterium]